MSEHPPGDERTLVVEGIAAVVLHEFACDCAARMLRQESALQDSFRKIGLRALQRKRKWLAGDLSLEALTQAHDHVWQVARRVQTALEFSHMRETQLATRSKIWAPVGILWAAAYASQVHGLQAEEIAQFAAYNASSAADDAALERAWQIAHLRQLHTTYRHHQTRLLAALQHRRRHIHEHTHRWHNELEEALF